jgi:glycosyltransferase involved in cell wall biosynthesis
MKILMLTPYLPYPPDSGGQIRTLNLLKYLSKSHEITLVALYKNEQQKQYASGLEEYCKEVHVCKRPEKPWQISNILKSVFSFLPFLIVRNFSPEAKRVVHRLLEEEEFDVIHAETFYIMPHIPETKVPILLVEQTIEFKVYQHFVSTLPFFLRFGLWLDIFKLKFWEIYYWKKASLVAAVSQSDKQIIDNSIHRTTTEVIPNGAGDQMFALSVPEKNITKPKLLFVGNFSWLQNTEAAEYLLDKVLPLLTKEMPSIEVIIAGQNLNSKTSIIENNQVTCIDIAPEDDETIRKVYDEATLFVAPIFGPGGTRLKILAAMASGLPIIASRTGIEGLNVKIGQDVLVANNPKEFVSCIKTILSDNKLYQQMQQNAYKLVKEKYSWGAIAKKLEIVYKNIT